MTHHHTPCQDAGTVNFPALACRHLIKDRLDITGARWSVDGAEAVLRLRALRSSGDFEAYWAYHEAHDYRRNHLARYKNGILPKTADP
jgi:hypothetical protein